MQKNNRLGCFFILIVRKKNAFICGKVEARPISVDRSLVKPK